MKVMIKAYVFQYTCMHRVTSPFYLGMEHQTEKAGPRSAVGNVSGYRCESDCRSRGREFDHSRRVVVSYKRKYVHELLVNRLFKPAQEKVWLVELTVPQ